MIIEQIVLEDGKIKGTNVTPKKIGETQKIRVDTKINGFFGGCVELRPTVFDDNIQERLKRLQTENKEYLEANKYAKARRNSKKYRALGTFNEHYKAFIDFYKL